ncbi:MAG TPA: 50S ribosomal protein L10 [Candidatus Paceibacterota bacterium]|nr:50S ribosomal protein L10 [Candidatus Paceibacterota bacterium]
MAITKDKKRDILAKLTGAFANASSVVFVGFTKLTVADASALRKELSGAGVRYFVAKKTLIKKALGERGYAGDAPELPGEVAVAWTEGDDTTASARGIYEFGKKVKGALTFLGGVFENAFMGADAVTGIATIPPVPVLRGMFVNVINSPIQGIVIALDKISKQRSEATVAN